MEERDSIRERVTKNRLSFKWLIFQLSKRGIETDKSEISSIFAGTRKGQKADTIIKTTSEILTEYENVFVHET